MRLKPGCGCAVLVLALVNMFGFLFALLAASGIGREGNITGGDRGLYVGIGFLFLANAIVSVLVGWGSVRAGGLRLPSMLEGEEEE